MERSRQRSESSALRRMQVVRGKSKQAGAIFVLVSRG
jgi:hypothetical protein